MPLTFGFNIVPVIIFASKAKGKERKGRRWRGNSGSYWFAESIWVIHHQWGDVHHSAYGGR